MQTKMIHIDNLEKSEINARRTTNKLAFADLVASIEAHGLLQNLVVTEGKKGKYEVIAGGRRLDALRSLQQKDETYVFVRCEVVEAEKAAEMSLAENIVRQAMHPADEFEAFAKLAAAGQTAEQIATRFGAPAKHVEQRLQLGRVHPDLIKAYRDEKIILESLMAFTITDDQKRQLAVYKSLKQWERDRPNAIRGRLAQKMYDSNNARVKFVTLEAYSKAGGATRKDLFEDNTYIENTDLFDKLFNEKVEESIEKVKKEGWAWAEYIPENSHEYTRKMHRLFEPFTKAQKAIAGAIMTFSYDGKMQINRGYVKAADKKSLNNLNPKKKGKSEPQKSEGMSQALIDSLKDYRLEVAQLAIMRNPDIAYDLMVFNAALAYHHKSTYTGPDIHFSEHYPRSLEEQADSKATNEMEAIGKALNDSWMKHKNEAQMFDAFRQLTPREKQEILAFCIARTLRAQLYRADSAFELALASTGIDVADYWRPTQENYLGRIGKTQLLEIGEELKGKEWADKHKDAKKGPLAHAVELIFKSLEADEKTKSWLPEGMQFSMPEEKKPAKKKKAA